MSTEQPIKHSSSSPQTLFDKLWAMHEVEPEASDRPALIYVDLHLIHEVTSPQAFAELSRRGLSVRRPDRTYGTIDHSTPTTPVAEDGRRDWVTADAEHQVETLRTNCKTWGIALEDWDSSRRGIVHVMGPELGLTRPGMTIVCGDSHTSTHGAFGAIAFGIGTTEVGHVLATQCLMQRKPKTMAIEINGPLAPGVDAKDVVLHVIGQIGVGGGRGHAIEFCGSTVRAMSMEQRMTLCNMSIEAGARCGLVAPDQTTFDYLQGRRYAPSGADWDQALTHWQRLVSDPAARFDRHVVIDARAIAPTVSWGVHPGQVIAVDGQVPATPDADQRRGLRYMGFAAGDAALGRPVQVVFVGSCTNGRLSDLRQAASLLRGRRVHSGVRMLVVPGSGQVKRDAEAEGLDRIFIEAGAQWREPGCSMCIAMNGDLVAPGELAVSTSNRNFEGRQGPGSRTVLASPLTAAACAIAGRIADPREFLQEVAA